MVLGITGKSGSGKHTAAEFLRQKGWVILDADRIAHHLYRPYTRVWKAVSDRFGEGILSANDTIDRQKLGQIVFNGENPAESEKALKDLNAILHPAIREYLKNELYHLKQAKKPLIAIIGALWEEVGLHELCEKLLLIKADRKMAFDRIQKRDGSTEAAYRERVKNQALPEKPDFTVENNGTFQEFYKSLNSLGLG